ncbi:MAG: hypothetical protein OXG81_16210 [Acidobacteria bacterium]|nr:hypothetical protein [Acidobacteriota bacterium]
MSRSRRWENATVDSSSGSVWRDGRPGQSACATGPPERDDQP